MFAARQVTKFMTFTQRHASTVKVGDKVPSALVAVVKHGANGFQTE